MVDRLEEIIGLNVRSRPIENIGLNSSGHRRSHSDPPVMAEGRPTTMRRPWPA